MEDRISIAATRVDSNVFNNVGSKIVNQVGHQTINGGQTNYLFVMAKTQR
jgi:hypothetical protein